MKKYIYSFIAVLTLLVSISCDDGFEELNQDPFNPTETSIPPVFNSLIASLVRQWQPQTQLEYEGMGVASQLTATYGTSGYLPANAAKELWENYYKAESDRKLLERLIEAGDPDVNYSNLNAQKDIIHAFKTLMMLDYFGDIPYYDAVKANDGPEYFYPKYDDQKQVYLEMLQLLKSAESILNLSPGENDFKVGGNDVLLGDNILKWKKFANSLRLRHALKAYDADNSLGSHVADILGGNLPLVEDGEDIKFEPVKHKLDLRGPIWAYGGGFVRFSESVWDVMADGTTEADIFDPRLRLFAEVNSTGVWNPMPNYEPGPETGTPNAEGRADDPTKAGTYTFSPINYWMLTGRDFLPELIFTAAEVNFLKAEGYAKGVGVSVNMSMAKAEYEAGIKSSINYWFTLAKASRDFGTKYSWKNVPPDPTTSDIDAMLANTKVAWNDTNALKLIYTQRWVSHIRQIEQGWNVYRQTRITPHNDLNTLEFNRSVYPESEANNNADNYAAQVSKMGGDESTAKVWWAK